MQSALASDGDFKYYAYKWEEHVLKSEEVGEIAYILYDAEAFSVLVNFSKSRFIGTLDFMGGYIQTVLNSGFRVTDPDFVFIIIYLFFSLYIYYIYIYTRQRHENTAFLCGLKLS